MEKRRRQIPEPSGGTGLPRRNSVSVCHVARGHSRDGPTAVGAGPRWAEPTLKEQELNYHKKQEFSWLSERTDEVHLKSPGSGKTTCEHAHGHTRTDTDRHGHAHGHTDTCTHMDTETHTLTRTCTGMHGHTWTRMDTQTHMRPRTRTRMLTPWETRLRGRAQRRLAGHR